MLLVFLIMAIGLNGPFYFFLTFQCQLVVDSATHLPHPRSGDSAAAWSATAYSLSTTATSAHLSRSQPLYLEAVPSSSKCSLFGYIDKHTNSFLYHTDIKLLHNSSTESSSSSDRVDSRGPLRQPRVATTTSFGPLGTNAEWCTVADLLDP